MTTLMIKDLSRNEELSAKAMARVHGGLRLDFDVTKITVEDVNQEIGQSNKIDAVLGANLGLVEEFKRNKQDFDQTNTANNNVYVYA